MRTVDQAEPPETADLPMVAIAAKGCTACPLWRKATQTVFGEGPRTAKIMMVGEQPGDKEDKAGRPFVGQAGKFLDRCLGEAGIERSQVYMTNAVKHFKWEPSGARRLHKKPNQREVFACYPWLVKEIELVEPQIIVCLGATAAQALLGKDFKVTERRGVCIAGPLLKTYMATVHPSSILRSFDRESREEDTAHFISDLKIAASFVDATIANRISLR